MLQSANPAAAIVAVVDSDRIRERQNNRCRRVLARESGGCWQALPFVTSKRDDRVRTLQRLPDNQKSSAVPNTRCEHQQHARTEHQAKRACPSRERMILSSPPRANRNQTRRSNTDPNGRLRTRIRLARFGNVGAARSSKCRRVQGTPDSWHGSCPVFACCHILGVALFTLTKTVAMNARSLLLAVASLMSIAVSAAGQTATVRLEWDPNSDASLAGYIVYVGNASGSYQEQYDAGLQTSFVYTNAVPGRLYFFSVAAYALGPQVGPRSDEVLFLAGVAGHLPAIGRRTQRNVETTRSASAAAAAIDRVPRTLCLGDGCYRVESRRERDRAGEST